MSDREAVRGAAEFSGKVALVMGASRGIGAEIARAFAARGARVGLVARSTDAIKALAEQIRTAGGEAISRTADLTDAAQVADAVGFVRDEFGGLDLAVNNAGFNPGPKPTADVDDDDFAAAIATNLTAVFYGLKHEIGAMLAGGRGGAIVTMASGAGVRARSHLGPYVAGKAGAVALSQVAALEYADRGIRVNVLAPGPILTEHIQRAGEEAQRLAAAAVPAQRMGTTADVARAAMWLCSAASDYITGAVIPVDGGQLAGERLYSAYDPGRGMTRTT